jgi:hypothetical protein
MNVSKSVYTSTNMSVTLTVADIQEYIRNKFNISSNISINVDFSNVINKEIGVNWMESTTSH